MRDPGALSAISGRRTMTTMTLTFRIKAAFSIRTSGKERQMNRAMPSNIMMFRISSRISACSRPPSMPPFSTRPADPSAAAPPSIFNPTRLFRRRRRRLLVLSAEPVRQLPADRPRPKREDGQWRTAHVEVIKHEYHTVLTKNGDYFRYESQEEDKLISSA